MGPLSGSCVQRGGGLIERRRANRRSEITSLPRRKPDVCLNPLSCGLWRGVLKSIPSTFKVWTIKRTQTLTVDFQLTNWTYSNQNSIHRQNVRKLEMANAPPNDELETITYRRLILKQASFNSFLRRTPDFTYMLYITFFLIYYCISFSKMLIYQYLLMILFFQVLPSQIIAFFLHFIRLICHPSSPPSKFPTFFYSVNNVNFKGLLYIDKLSF